MKSTYAYKLVIGQKEYEYNRDAIRAACNNSAIINWAFILHDKEVYNEHDMAVRRLECQKNWANGFEGMEKYSSASEYVEKRMSEPPLLGDKKDSLWQIVVLTDKIYQSKDVGQWFSVSESHVRKLQNMIDVAKELEGLSRVNFPDSYHYPDSEIESNFDLADYINEEKKVEKWLLVKRGFDPAMIGTICMMGFFIAVAIKLGSQNGSWIAFGVVGFIGILWILLNLNTIRISKKQNRYVSGIPFIGGIHLLVAGLISPCKWLAFLCVLDYTILSFFFAILITNKKQG